jgi:hypothetical protein
MYCTIDKSTTIDDTITIMEYGSAIDTEVMDFGGDKFSSSEFGQRPPMLFSMQRSFEPEVFNSSVKVTSSV